MPRLKKVGTTGKISRGASGIRIDENNIDKVLDILDDDTEKALTMIGIKAEKYAKARCPVGTPESTGIKGYRGGTLRNSITFEVTSDNGDGVVVIGSNVEYAPYVELGTGPYFEAPPAWEEFDAPKGSGSGKGYVRPRPYLKPAIEDHIRLYMKIIKDVLSGH